ncbi:DM13 domain-containing protein [Yoonia maritima]|uniref:DM13 domain-containing protein n=1 Tax=Yoonia maritima TaxID=1435347 RepID=UPI0013A613DB|nr:DM13 domain-containing protein [Yoonia maritima]
MDRRSFIAVLLSTAALPAFAGGHGRLGTWGGINGHTVTGTAEIAGSEINLLDDFVFDGAPDPKVALGKDGVYDPATIMGPLASDTGASQYMAPEGIDTSAYNEVWIWCEEFNVGLAVAPIT